MKFVLSLVLLSLFYTPLVAQEEIPLEEVFKKIEARLSPIDSLEGRVHIEGMGVMGAELNVIGWVGFRRGEFLWRDASLWKMPEGLFRKEEYYGTSLVAVRGLFTGDKRGEALSYAYKSSPGKASMPRRGMIGLLEMMTGMEWSLWDIALWPRQILSRYMDAKAFRTRESVVIQASWKMEGLLGNSGDPLKIEWHFNSDYRIEKMQTRISDQTLEVRVLDYASVQGVEIPCRIEYEDRSMPGSGGALVTLALDQIQSPSGIESPRWLKDSALPESTYQTVEEAEAKLKADPTNGAHLMDLGNMVMFHASRSGRNMTRWAQQLHDYTGPALKASPDSSLLLLSHFVSRAMAEKEIPEDLLASLLSENVLASDALAVAVMISLAKGDKEKANEFLQKMPAGRTGYDFRRKVGLKLNLQAVSSADEFIRIVDGEIEGLPLSRKLSVLSTIAAPVRSFGGRGDLILEKSPEFLAKLAETGRGEYMLLAGRAYCGKSDFEKAVPLYLLLVDLPEYGPLLKNEVVEVCKKGAKEAMPLVEKVYESIEDPALLLLAARESFEAGKELSFLTYQKRLIAVCTKKESGKNPFSSYRNTEQLVPLLQGLVKAERLLEAKDLLLAYVNKTNGSNLLYGEGKGLLPTILADDFQAKYRLLKAIGVSSTSFGVVKVEQKEFISEVRRRVESDGFEKDDLESLSKLVVEKPVNGVPEIMTPELGISLFQKGSKKYPEEGLFFERLGDFQYYARLYEAAVGSYQEVLRLRKLSDSKRSLMRIQSAVSSHLHEEEVAGKQGGLDMTQPVLAKMVHAFVSEGREKEALKEIEKFLVDFSKAENIEEASAAYTVLKREDRILPLKRTLFLEQIQDENRLGWGDPAIKTGFDLLTLYKKEKNYVDAYLVCGFIEKRLGERSNPENRKRLEKENQSIRKKLSHDDLISEYLKMGEREVSKEQKALVDDLVEKMDGDLIATRDEAFESLRGMSPEISGYLYEQLEGQSTEVASRLKEILVLHAEKALRKRFQNP